MAEEKVKPLDPAKHTSAFNAPPTEVAALTEATAAVERYCYWNGQNYRDGQTICDANQIRWRCSTFGSPRWEYAGNCP